MDRRPDDHDRPGLTHDRPCGHCGHAVHHGLPCSPTCDCRETY